MGIGKHSSQSKDKVKVVKVVDLVGSIEHPTPLCCAMFDVPRILDVCELSSPESKLSQEDLMNRKWGYGGGEIYVYWSLILPP